MDDAGETVRNLLTTAFYNRTPQPLTANICRRPQRRPRGPRRAAADGLGGQHEMGLKVSKG